MHCQTTWVSNIIAVYYECFALMLFGGVSKSVCPWHIRVWVRGVFCFRWSLAVLALVNIHFGLFILIGLLTWWILAVPRSKRIINFGPLVILGGNFGPFRGGRWSAAEVVICRFSVFYFLIVTSYAQVYYKRELIVDILHCRHTRNGRKG